MSDEPQATEETDHVWIDNGKGGEVNLTAEIAEIIAEGVTQHDLAPEEIANRILQIPAIKDRLHLVIVGPPDMAKG